MREPASQLPEIILEKQVLLRAVFTVNERAAYQPAILLA